MLSEPARAFVERQRVAHLATASADGSPHVVPVCFALVGDTVYIAIDEKPKQAEARALRRLRNIQANPRVALVFDEYDDADWSKLGFVLVRCVGRLVQGDQERVEALAALRAKYAQYRGMALEGRPLIAAEIRRVTTWGTADGR